MTIKNVHEEDVRFAYITLTNKWLILFFRLYCKLLHDNLILKLQLFSNGLEIHAMDKVTHFICTQSPSVCRYANAKSERGYVFDVISDLCSSEIRGESPRDCYVT